MGKVTEHLSAMLAKQVKEKGIVVWYDPEKAYTELTGSLAPPDTDLLCFRDSFFQLRQEIEAYIEFLDADDRPVRHCDIPPKLLIYVPVSRQETQNALIESESAGTIMEAGNRLGNYRTVSFFLSLQCRINDNNL
jgi:hypothetical protein